jgi:AcrR family transcriptional regulator
MASHTKPHLGKRRGVASRRDAKAPRARRRADVGDRSGDERASLLRAVARLMGQRKTAVVSLRQAADRAGISHSALKRQFGNRCGLLTAYAAEGFDRMAETITEELGRRRPRDGAGVLDGVGQGYMRFARENPEQFALMFGSERVNFKDRALADASARAWGLLTSTIERCAAEGKLRRADTERAAVASWSLVHGLAALWLGSPRRDHLGLQRNPEQIGASVTRLFVEALLRADHARPVR